MRKERISIKEIIKLPLIGQGESSWILKDKNTIIKLYKPSYLNMEKKIGINTERKMLRSKEIKSIPEIEVPTSIIYDENNNFIATRSNYIRGINYNEFINEKAEAITENLETIFRCHEKFEDLLKRATKSGIVLPDFTSCDNIMITNNNKKDPSIKIIDYDGVQIGNEPIMDISSSLLTVKKQTDITKELIFTPKYKNINGSFTGELNIYSQYVLFFLELLHVDITGIGKKLPSGHTMTYDMFFGYLGLDDYDLQNKIWKLFQQNKKNEFLEDDKYTILEKYDIICGEKCNGIETRRLIRKR